jgi:predicted metalloprotease with PDZ domain
VGVRHALFLGVDWLALNENSNLDVLISHELFHAYQSEINPQAFAEYVSNIDKAPLYKTLWTEGLATYVSRAFNPKAPLSEILMDKNLAARAPGCLNTAARELREKLDSTSTSDRKRFFAYRSPEADQTSAEPSRIGYFVGMKVAEELARNYSLLDLAHLHGAELEYEIGAALQRITERNTPDS